MSPKRKLHLLTPGPTPVPEDVLEELAQPVDYHRTAEFRALLAQVLEDLRYVCQTAGDVIALTSSGTGAMEAAVVNTLAPGAKAFVLEAGRFAQRWTQIARAFGIEVVTLEVPWGQAIDPHDVARGLREHPDVEAVFGTLCETSTGVGHDIEGISHAVAETDALFVVDGISGVGAMECRADQWGIDLLVVGSQKGLMIPPGLAFTTVSQRAWQKIDSVNPRAFYFDLRRYREKLAVPDVPFTPANTLMRALAKSLERIRREGIENVWRRTTVLAEACRAGIRAMGLDLFAARPAPALTAVKVPEGIDGVELLRRLRQDHGVTLAGGQAVLKGQIFRIAHMGHIRVGDVIVALAAIEKVLKEMGYPITLGRAVSAAQKVLAEQPSTVVPT